MGGGAIPQIEKLPQKKIINNPYFFLPQVWIFFGGDGDWGVYTGKTIYPQTYDFSSKALGWLQVVIKEYRDKMLVYEDKSIPDYLNLPNTSPHTPLAGWREPPAAMNLKDLLCRTELFLREKEENKKTNYKVNSIRFLKTFDLSETFN